MTCETFTADAPLYLYGELPPEQEERFEAHVEACASCKRELEGLRAMGRALDRRRLEPSPVLLAECREGLMRVIEQDAAHSRSWFSLSDLLGPLVSPMGGLRYLAAAGALVALGFVAARVTGSVRPFGGQMPVSGNRESAAAGFAPSGVVSGIESSPSGQVRIALDETNHRVISGRPDDAQIQQLLLRAALNQANPGLRVESITLLKDQSSSEPVRRALLNALEHDPNPGVRLKAIEGLRNFASDAAVREVLVGALLEDTNPGVRIQAIDVLTIRSDEELVGVLQSIVQKEENNYIRMRCQNVLHEMNASVGAF